MEDLTVDPSYLHELAGAQRRAVTDLGNAAAAADGVGANLWATHGVYTAQGNLAVGHAVTARHAAGQAMAQLSSFLAEQLDAAARIYAGVDQQESADIARSEISTDE